MKELPQINARMIKINTERRETAFKCRILPKVRFVYTLPFNLAIMNRKILFVSYFIAAAFFSCQSNDDGKPKVEVQAQTIQGDSVYTMANLAVEGMMCAHACGGKIQQELRKMPGITGTELDFIEDRKVNVVHVQFDPSLTDEQKMIAKVNEIVDGKYTVVGAQRITSVAK
jgi:copper chaperone CopZ